MRTSQEWIDALEANHYIDVVSTDALIHKVEKAQRRRTEDFRNKGEIPPPMKSGLTTVVEFASQPSLSLKPINLLHALGRATTPIVTNLVDLSSTWASLRYIWAFEPHDNTPLRLTAIARDLDRHQKVLLSDQIGVGMAAYLMHSCLKTVNSVDVDVALRDSSWSIRPQFSTRPDYLFYDQSLQNLFVVECKGSQSSVASSIDQLRRGTEQVPSIVFTNGQHVPEIVIATCMLDDCTKVFVIDPPPDESGSSSKKREPRLIDDLQAFNKDLVRLRRASILNFIGREKAALDLLPFKVHDLAQRGSPENRSLETRDGFRGVAEIVHLGSRRVELFRVVAEELYEGLSINEPDDFKSLPEFEGENGSDQAAYQTRRDSGMIQSIARDGTTIQLVFPS